MYSDMESEMASSSNFIHVRNDQHYQDLVKDAGERLIIVDFTASWCGPCHHIAPYFEKLSERFIDVLFLKVDVDQCQETAIANGVSAMPTFHAIKNGVKVEQINGANPHALVSMIEKWVKLSQSDDKKVTISVGRSFESFLGLRKNSDETFLDVSELLIKFASNVLKDPKSERYRTVRLENKIFQSRLLPIAGAVESLFTMGFEEQDDKLVLPQGSPLDNLVAMRDALLDEREKINIKNSPIDLHPPIVVEPKLRKWKPFIRNSREKSFYERLNSTSDHVFIYEDAVMMSFACLKIPLEELKRKAKEQSLSTGSPSGSVNDWVDERDCLLLLLLNWFKCDFFKWMDQPTCTFCDVTTQSIGHVTPTSVDRKWGAGTVESYNCPQCSRKFTFPRYNHPQKLLETRTGRCGEWANCFTACCRAAGFEARYVLDWTDHVWTEVYSEHQKRWLHCDACENVCDKPLLYEAGWGKKLTYVFAFSKDEVIDVTWRYSQDHKETLTRRKEVGESWLVSLWTNMSKELQSSLTDVRNKELETRRISELVEFLKTKEVNTGEKIGRQSGSAAWRRIRGEDGGHNDETIAVSEDHYVFIPTMSELEDGRMRIRYCAASDEYLRGDGGSIIQDVVSIKGWENGTSKSKDVFRKVEHDWKMVYLARKEGSAVGCIEWRLKVENPLFVFDQIILKLSSKIYENGSVMMMLKSGEVIENVESSEGSTCKSKSFKGCSELQLSVHLSGGRGDVAWQHAQLFRQTLDSKDEYPFDFTITFCKK